MAIILNNAMLAQLDPPRVEHGGLRIEGERIVERGANIVTSPCDEVVNCGGAVVLPGFVNGHTHLYSALAIGMPPPPQAPRDFLEILKFVWWRLDQALDAESIEASARIGASLALRCGTTTLIDHHASPNCITGSLDLVERGLTSIGVRGVLCYETTDRHGRSGREAGLEENRRYLDKCQQPRDSQFASLIGAHASFTLEDDTLEALAAMASQYEVGVHIHVAEDPCDEEDSRSRHNSALVERLERRGLLRSASILAHCTHLSPDAVARVNAVGSTVAHNTRSNMNNAVGYAPVASFHCPVMLGTDGIGGDMLAEARAAWFMSRHQHTGLTPTGILSMLSAAARRASTSLGVTLGTFDVGAAADIVITDHIPFTPLSTDNLVGHFLFGLSSNHVHSVLVDGHWRLRDRVLVGRDESADRMEASETARALWTRMSRIPA